MTSAQAQSVLITGCSSGIGRCSALGLKARGYRVFATARKPADVAALAALGLESLALDLDSSDSIRGAVAEGQARTGGGASAPVENSAPGLPRGAGEPLRAGAA